MSSGTLPVSSSSSLGVSLGGQSGYNSPLTISAGQSTTNSSMQCMSSSSSSSFTSQVYFDPEFNDRYLTRRALETLEQEAELANKKYGLALPGSSYSTAVSLSDSSLRASYLLIIQSKTASIARQIISTMPYEGSRRAIGFCEIRWVAERALDAYRKKMEELSYMKYFNYVMQQYPPSLFSSSSSSISSVSLSETSLYSFQDALTAIIREHFPTQLAEWHKSLREMYEREVKKCVNQLIDCLYGAPETLGRLERLGLSPGQIGNRYTESDLSYFRDMMQKLETMPRDVVKRIFAQFQQHYPAIFKKLVSDMRMVEETTPREDLRKAILDRLTARVAGQRSAAEILATSLASQQNQGGGKATYIFVGPTGVGKTEMAKAVASHKNDRFITFAMNLYQSKETVCTLFGSPASYRGSNDKPHFAKKVEQYQPIQIVDEDSLKVYRVKDVVLLFDELEKAHSKVKQSLLTLIDEGYVEMYYTTDPIISVDRVIPSRNVTIKYIFESSVFIGTSNLYQSEVLKAFQRGEKTAAIIRRFKTLNEQIPTPSSFSPEFLARFTVLPFGPIPRGEVYQNLLQGTMRSFMQKLREEIHCLSVEVEEERRILTILEPLLYEEGVDIRRAEKFFSGPVKNFIYAEKSKWGDLRSKKLVFVPFAGDKLGIKVLHFLFETLIEERIPATPIVLSSEEDVPPETGPTLEQKRRER